MPLDDLSREPDHDRRLQLMHFSCPRNGRQFRELGGFYSHYFAGGFALWRRRNSIRRYSATPEREFESQFPLFLLDNHSTYINSCFLPVGVFATLSCNIPREKGKQQWEQANTNGSIIPSESVKPVLCRTWRSSASATRCLPRPGAFWTPPKRTKNPCGVV